MLRWLRHLYGRMESAILDHGLYRPGRLLLVMVGILAVRGLGDDIFAAFSGDRDSMFFPANDRYADFIKVALSYSHIFTETLASKAYLNHWPYIFRLYLLDNPYDLSAHNLSLPDDQADVTNLHLPPFASVLYLSCAHLIAATNPLVAMAVFWGAYLIGGWGVARMARAHFGVSRQCGWFILFAALACYPVLWMRSRGNLAGGYSGLLTLGWLATAVSGRGRWAGWVMLALSVNLRPEPALLVLIELLGSGSLRARFCRMAIPGAMSVALAAIAFPIAHALYPLYTLDNVRRGLRIYHYRYIVSDMGDEWNASLFLWAKGVLMLMDVRPRYNETLAQALELCGSAALLLAIWGAWARRITLPVLVFLLTALPAMFVPVYSYYHIVAFVAVLALLVADLERNPPRRGDRRLPLLIVTVLVMSPLGGAYSNGLIDSLLMLGGTLYGLAPLARDAFRALGASPISAPVS